MSSSNAAAGLASEPAGVVLSSPLDSVSNNNNNANHEKDTPPPATTTVTFDTTAQVLHPMADRAATGAATSGSVGGSGAAMMMDDDDEEVCGICLEKPPVDGFVKLWCCHNILCVTDAQHIGKCPFCRTEPLIWDIEK